MDHLLDLMRRLPMSGSPRNHPTAPDNKEGQ